MFFFDHVTQTKTRRSLANSLATWAHRPDWNSQTCPTDWLQSLKCPPQDGAAGSSHLLSCCVFVLSFCWTPLPQDGDKSWHTWPSARFLRISLLELLLQQETLDSRSWQHLILRRRQKNWTQSWRTAALQWWRSSACSSRQGSWETAGNRLLASEWYIFFFCRWLDIASVVQLALCFSSLHYLQFFVFGIGSMQFQAWACATNLMHILV